MAKRFLVTYFSNHSDYESYMWFDTREQMMSFLEICGECHNEVHDAIEIEKFFRII